MGAGASHAALGYHDFYQQERSVPLATEVAVLAEPLVSSEQLRRIPRHLVTESLVAYLSPAEIDAFLLTCTEYFGASEAVWRMRWQRDQVDAAREAGGYVSEEGHQEGAELGLSVGGGGGEMKSPDGDGDGSGANDLDPDVAAAIAASLRDVSQAANAGEHGAGAVDFNRMTNAVPDPDFIEDSPLLAQTKTHRRRVFDAWLRRERPS